MRSNPNVVCADDICITCSDEGRPGTILSLPVDAFDPARVLTDAGEEDVDITLVHPVGVGDRVLVHAGVAITRLDPEPQT